MREDQIWRAPVLQPGERKPYTLDVTAFIGGTTITSGSAVVDTPDGKVTVVQTLPDPTGKQLQVWLQAAADASGEYHVTATYQCADTQIRKWTFLVPCYAK